MEAVLCNMPWWAILVLGLAVIFLIAYLVHKQVSIKLGKLSIETEKKIIKQNQDNSVRLKIYAQIREYENYTGKIERIIYNAFHQTYPELNSDEQVTVKLFCSLVRRALEKQLMLDLIANGIVYLSDDELRDYTRNKSAGYENRISNFLSAYNEIVLPNKNILEIVQNIDMQNLEDIYYNIYLKCVNIVKKKD